MGRGAPGKTVNKYFFFRGTEERREKRVRIDRPQRHSRSSLQTMPEFSL